MAFSSLHSRYLSTSWVVGPYCFSDLHTFIHAPDTKLKGQRFCNKTLSVLCKSFLVRFRDICMMYIITTYSRNALAGLYWAICGCRKPKFTLLPGACYSIIRNKTPRPIRRSSGLGTLLPLGWQRPILVVVVHLRVV